MVKKELGEEDSEGDIFLEDNIPKDFEDLDKTFRCPICADLFDKAVTIKDCGHTYCSVCIRRYFTAIRTGVHRQAKSCPTCRTTINALDVEKALVMNRSIQEGVKAFKQILLNHHRSSKDEVLHSPSTRSQRRRRKSKRKSPATIDNSQSTHGQEIYFSENDSERGDEEKPIQQKIESRNYARMKKKDLQRLCKNWKIPTYGSEQELLDRIRKYQNMWNAEVFSIDPKKPSDIAAKLTKEEQAQRDEMQRAQKSGVENSKEYMKKLNASRKSGDRKITSGDATFDEKLKANFDAMTAQLQSRTEKNTKSSSKILKASNIDESLDTAYNDNDKHLSCGMKKRTPVTVPTVSSIETNGVEHCSSNSTDTNQKTESLSPPIHQASLRGTKPSSTIPVHRISFAGKRGRDKKKTISPSSSFTMNRIGWACGRCTYENKGIDYVCQMCGHRKI
jgi:hypothetical protein